MKFHALTFGLFFGTFSLGSNAVAASVHERTCAILESGAGPRVLTLLTRDLQFRATLEGSSDPTKVEIEGIQSSFSDDHKIENYKGRVGTNPHGPSNATVIIRVDGTQRSGAGKSPTSVKFRKFIFGGRSFTAECGDWQPAADSRW